MNLVDTAFKNVLIAWSVALGVGLILLFPTFMDIFNPPKKRSH
jgi:hypothetical protein